MKLTIPGIFLFGLLSAHCISQNVSNDTLPSSAVVTPSGALLSSGQNKMHVNIMAGTEFWTAPGYGSGMGTEFLVGITQPLSKRFSIGGGIGIINRTPIGAQHSSIEYFGNPNSTNALVYVTGQYLLNQHITVSGTLFKEFSVFDNSPEYQRFQKNMPQGAYMKVRYKINDYMQIEAGFGYSRGINPYGTSFLGSPLYDSPFPFRNP
jgi:hypothetical protein